MAATFDPYHRWLGIDPAEQPPNFYRLLGVKLFESVPEVIENAADQRMAHLRTLSTGPNAPHAQRLLNEVSTARLCLLTPEKKQQYDHQLRSAGVGAPAGKPAPAAASAASLPTAKPLPSKPQPAKPQPAAGQPHSVPMGQPAPSVAPVAPASSVRRRSSGSALPLLLVAGGAAALLGLIVVGMVAAFAFSGSDDSSDSNPITQTDSDDTDGTPIPQPVKVSQDIFPLRISFQGAADPPSQEEAANFALARQTRPGSWTQPTADGVTVDVAAPPAPMLPLPFKATGDYTLELTVVPPENHAGLALDVAIAGRRCRLMIDQTQSEGFYTGFIPASAKALQQGKHPLRHLSADGEKRIVCTVEGNEVRVSNNETTIFQWTGDATTLPTATPSPTPSQVTRDKSSELLSYPFTIKLARVWRLEPPMPMPPPSPEGEVDLIAAVDPARDVLAGSVTRDGDTLMLVGKQPSMVQLPCDVPDDYLLDMRLKRFEVVGPVVIVGIVIGDRPGRLLFDATTDDQTKELASGIGLIDGRRPIIETNATSVVGKQLLPSDKPVDVQVLVQGKRTDGMIRIAAAVDGVKVVEFLGAADRLTAYEQWDRYLRKPCLSVGCWDSNVQFDRIVLTTSDKATLSLRSEGQPTPKPGSPEPAPPEPEKLVLAPVPDEAALAVARKAVAEAFGRQRTEAENRLAKQALINQLLDTAGAESDSTKKYALLDEALEISLEIGDPAFALATIDARAKKFDVDRWSETSDALDKILKSKSDLQRNLAIGASLEVIGEALQDRQFDVAGTLAEGVQKAATDARMGGMRQHMAKLLQRIDAGRQEEADAKAARETLAATPDDAAASAVLGRWLCLSDGNWKEGLPLLAKGDDPAFRPLAEQELALADDAPADAQAEVAGAWWTFGEKQTDPAMKLAIYAHAAEWYRKALPTVESVLTRRTVDDRLKKYEALAAAPIAGNEELIFTPWSIRDALLLYTFERGTVGRGADGNFYVGDVSGQGVHGAMEGSPAARTRQGKAGLGTFFEGRDDDIVCNGLRAKMSGLKEFTLAAWVLLGKTDGGTAFIFDVGSNADRSVGLYFKEGKLIFNMADNHGGVNMETPAAGAVGAWHHVAAVWDGREQRLYVDGRLAAREPCTITELNDTTLGAEEARIGAQAKSFFRGGRYFIGLMDEVILLPRAFSEQQVQQIFELGKDGTPLPALVEAEK